MNRCKWFLVFLLFLVFSSCKTQEEIRRQKTVENLNEQVFQTQKISANSNSRFVALEEEMSKLQGQIDENIHNKKQEISDINYLKERLKTLEENNKKQNDSIKNLGDKIQEQSKYIEQVINSLNALHLEKEEALKETLKNSKKEANAALEPNYLKTAIAKYKANDLDTAKEMFENLTKTKKLKKADKEALYYHLGMIYFKEKNYDEAKLYYSKLFLENHDSIYAASTLLNLAKTFLQLKSKEEAIQSLEELISRFPKSKEAIKAQKLKSKI